MTPNIAQIIAAFAEVTHVPIREIVSRQRSRSILKARHQAWYAARVLTGASYPEIAKAFGLKDHTSVMRACQKLAGDERYQRRLVQMRSKYVRKQSSWAGAVCSPYSP